MAGTVTRKEKKPKTIQSPTGKLKSVAPTKIKAEKSRTATSTTVKKARSSTQDISEKAQLKTLTSSKESNLTPMKTAKSNLPNNNGNNLKDFTGIGYLDIPPYQVGPAEEYMNSKQVEHFRKILWAWKKNLMEEVDRTVTHMKDEAANFPDSTDRASQEEGFSLELRTRDRERKLIGKIEETLKRIEHEDYGFCDACGIEIGIQRLEARPTATLCIDCKTLDEIRERQLKGA